MKKIKFVQFKPGPLVDPRKTRSAGSFYLEIPTRLVLSLTGLNDFGKQGDVKSQEHINLAIDLQISHGMVIGLPFSLLVNTSSNDQLWNDNPPPVTLTAFAMHINYVNRSTTDNVHFDDESNRAASDLIWEGKRLNIPLSSNPVDIGQIFSFCLGPHHCVISSFNTHLLQRKYEMKCEINVEVGGKSFKSIHFIFSSFEVIKQDLENNPILREEPPNHKGKKGHKKKGKEIPPPYGEGPSHGYESHLVKGVEKGMDLKAKEDEKVPAYIPGTKKHHFWDKKS